MGRRTPKIEAGLETITLTTGDGTATVTFDNPFENPPRVILTINDDDYETTDKYESLNASTMTASSFLIEMESDSAQGTIDIAWIAMERRSSER